MFKAIAQIEKNETYWADFQTLWNIQISIFQFEELWTSICYNLFDPIKSPTYFWLWVICQQRSFRGVAIYNEWFCGDACNCHARRAPFSSPNSHHRGWHPAYTICKQKYQSGLASREFIWDLSNTLTYIRNANVTSIKHFPITLKIEKFPQNSQNCLKNCRKCRFWIA